MERQWHTDKRKFKKCWEHDYLFTEVDSNAICLVCKQKVAVLKEYNIRRHYETMHSHQFAKYTGEDRKVKAANLLMKLDTQQQTLLQPSTVQEMPPLQVIALATSLSEVDTLLLRVIL